MLQWPLSISLNNISKASWAGLKCLAMGRVLDTPAIIKQPFYVT